MVSGGCPYGGRLLVEDDGDGGVYTDEESWGVTCDDGDPEELLVDGGMGGCP